MKQYLRILLVLLGLYLAACVAIGVTVAEIALHPHHRALTDAEQVYAPAWATDDGATLTNVEIKAADGFPFVHGKLILRIPTVPLSCCCMGEVATDSR